MPDDATEAVERLRDFIRANSSGGRRRLSAAREGGRCLCPLCDVDRLAASLGAPPQGPPPPATEISYERVAVVRENFRWLGRGNSCVVSPRECAEVARIIDGLLARSGSLSRETVERVNCGHGTAERVTVYHTGQGECLACRVAALTEKGDGNG